MRSVVAGGLRGTFGDSSTVTGRRRCRRMRARRARRRPPAPAPDHPLHRGDALRSTGPLHRGHRNPPVPACDHLGHRRPHRSKGDGGASGTEAARRFTGSSCSESVTIRCSRHLSSSWRASSAVLAEPRVRRAAKSLSWATAILGFRHEPADELRRGDELVDGAHPLARRIALTGGVHPQGRLVAARGGTPSRPWSDRAGPGTARARRRGRRSRPCSRCGPPASSCPSRPG